MVYLVVFVVNTNGDIILIPYSCARHTVHLKSTQFFKYSS